MNRIEFISNQQSIPSKNAGVELLYPVSVKNHETDMGKAEDGNVVGTVGSNRLPEAKAFDDALLGSAGITPTGQALRS